MTLNKNKLINETYHKFIQTSLSDLPLVGIHDFIDENIMGYGTAIDEKILSISDYRELIIRQREQGKDIGIQFDLTPVLRKILADGNSAIFVDEIVVTMVINDETSQLFVRVSTVLEYREDKWIVVHWHGSRPGDVEGETDTWHINEWKQKNEKLQRLVDEKTKDLLQKNRELEIEAALEKVRAVAMSMNRSEDLLSICEITFKEFQKLGFDNLRNAIIHILDDEKGFFMDYDYSDYLGGSINSINYNSHPIVDNYLKQIKKANDAFVEVVIEGDELDGWKEFRRKGGQLDDPRLDKISALHYYLYSIGVGDIGISTFSSIDESQIKILKRFRNVFDLAYRRYTDITKAEAQAREARIEAALEKVRSRTMAMQKSDELQETSLILFQQFKELGVQPEQISIGIVNEDEKEIEVSATLQGSKLDQTYKIKIDEGQSVLKKIYKAWEERGKSTVIDITGEELQEYNRWRNSLGGRKFYDTDDTGPTRWMINMAFFSKGMLSLSTHKPIPDETFRLLERFAGVFDLTYTRFLDLKQAEAQAREARIEAALEKVRSRTMAMQRSEELSEAASLLFNQIADLGTKAWSSGFQIWNADNISTTAWMSAPDGGFLTPLRLPHTEDPYFKSIYDARQRSKGFFVMESGGNELKETYRYMFSIPEWKKTFGDIEESGFPIPTFQITHCVFFPHGYLMFITYEPCPEMWDAFKRFGKVFEQTYTRFLDLKNAEKQNKIIQAENDRKTKELEEARQLQLAMLPKELPNLPNLDIAVYMQTATEVGGDYYDFHLQEDGTLTTVIGDATGHGMKAGTMVTITKSLFNSLASHKNILETFFKISDVVRRMKFRQLSMCLMMLKIKGNKLQVSSAAMPPALIYRKKKDAVEEIFIEGMPLGAMNDFPYSVKESHLQQGDAILLLSDGLPELSNGNNEMYGYDRIKTEFYSVGEKEPEEIVDHLKSCASQWANCKDPDDDVTFVVIKVK